MPNLYFVNEHKKSAAEMFDVIKCLERSHDGVLYDKFVIISTVQIYLSTIKTWDDLDEFAQTPSQFYGVWGSLWWQERISEHRLDNAVFQMNAYNSQL